jgi:hypothetical protein
MQRRDSSDAGLLLVSCFQITTVPIEVPSLHLDEMPAESQLIVETRVRRVCVDEHPGYLPGFEMGEHLAVYGMG